VTALGVVRAVVFFEHGGPEVLQVVDDWPAPVAGPGQVVVQVRACGLNHLDIFVRRGMPGVQTELPHVSGGDIAGVVSSVGRDVRGFQPGDRVLVDPAIDLGNGHVGALGETVQGGLCEAIAVPVTSLIALPDAVSFEQAASLPIAYGTAYRMLITRGRVVAGELVVVLGASGGVGTACVQLAKLAGASVVAVASTDDKLQRLQELGADHVIRARGAEFGAEVWRLTEKRGADVIVDYTGKETWPTSIRSLKMGGRLLTCGATTGFEAVTDLRYVWVREQTIIGSDGWRRDDLEALLKLVEDGRITPVIDRVWPLERTREAEEAIERREVFGKVIMVP
jgi:alcohol dehydrogenase